MENFQEKQNEFFDALLSKIDIIQGVDLICFLNKDFQVIREKNKSLIDLNVDNISNIIKSGIFNPENSTFSSPFKTCTLLNDNGLIIISKVSDKYDLYMVVFGGEKEPVDIINLLKLVKEAGNELINA